MRTFFKRVALGHWPVLVGWGFLAWVFLRIQTYVTGQDPMTYVGIARRLLLWDGQIGSLRQFFFYVAPGYPLILAGVIRLFGIFAVYWVNLVFGLATVVVTWLLLREILEDTKAAAFCLFGILWIVIGGYSLNAHFLLYPFRELPALFFILLGMLLFHRAVSGEKARTNLVIISSLAFVAAVSIREPSALAMVGPLGWCILFGRHLRRIRIRAILSFLLPWIVTLEMLVIAGMVAGVSSHYQFRSWSAEIFGRGLMYPFERFGRQVLPFASFLVSELGCNFSEGSQLFGWIGVCLAALGCWRVRRNSRFLFFFVVPAALFFVFYALCFPHRRYLIAALFFVSAFAGLGLDQIVRVLTRWPVLKQMRVSPFVPFVAYLLLIGGMCRTAASLGSWGLRVTFREAIAFRRAVESVSLPGNRVIADVRSRQLIDALACLTDMGPENTQEVLRLLKDHGWTAYAKPLNSKCLFERLDQRLWGVNPLPLLSHYADVSLMNDAEGRPVMWRLGEAEFALCQVTPWKTRSLREPVELVPGNEAVIWLDFRESDPDCPRNIRLLAEDGTEAGRVSLLRGNGINGIYLPGRLIREPKLWVEVISEQPFPASVVAAVQKDNRPVSFTLMRDRRLSTREWFLEPFAAGHLGSKYGASFSEGGVLRLPVPYGLEQGIMKVTLDLAPPERVPADKSVIITYKRDGQMIERKKVALQPGVFSHELQLAKVSGGGYAEVEVSVDPPDCRGTHFRVHNVSIQCSRSP